MNETREKYKKALKIAKSEPSLNCHVLQIERTLASNQFGVLETVWVDYFFDVIEKIYKQYVESKKGDDEDE